MNQAKQRIENFVEEVIKNKNNRLLDILWIFSYSIPSASGYHNNKETFKKWLGRICIRNLQKKYNLKLVEVKNRMKAFVDFLNGMPDFLSKETFYENDKLLREVLISNSSKALVQNVKKPQDLSDLDKKILSLVLSYIPIRIQDSVEEAEKFRQQNPNYRDKYHKLSDFHIRTNEETDEIDYFRIDPKEWTYSFNLLFDEELKEYKYKEKLYERISLPSAFWQYQEYSFWHFGDELVKIGIGYWTFYVSGKGKVSINLIIPNFIYEGIKIYKASLPTIENFREKIIEIKKEKEVEIVEETWGLEELIEEEVKESNEVLESEVEASIISNPEVLEEGLELIGNQYSTSVGNIDILYRDKNGNFVVVELKKGKGSYEVVGQIQKYLTWVSENLAEDKQVRGIIVVREYDKELEYAVKGSSFSIETKIFGKAPPIEENIKYCDRCGKPNKKSAKYCAKCGQEFWM